MELSQIKQELSQVVQVIHRAALAVQSDTAAQAELRNYLNELDSQSKQAQQMQDPKRLTQFIDTMEATGERAKSVCERNIKLGTPAKTAVQQAYQQLSHLKHQLH
ncbi:MAG TPA: hypothetical protein VF943_03000 [Burkholderiales bacterium]